MGDAPGESLPAAPLEARTGLHAGVNPALSVVVFTTVAGAGQGLVVALAAATLAHGPLGGAFRGNSLLLALTLLGVGLGASFLHLGRPERAWRAVLMWRTSWLSREVIVLPAFMA